MMLRFLVTATMTRTCRRKLLPLSRHSNGFVSVNLLLFPLSLIVTSVHIVFPIRVLLLCLSLFI